VVLGGVLIFLAVWVFVQSLQIDRLTFPYDAGTFEQRWNHAAAGIDRLELAIDPISPRLDDTGDLVFAHAWSDTFMLRGRIDPETDRVVELAVLGDRNVDGGELMVDAMDLLIRSTEPDLDGEQRLSTLQELGLVGGDPTADLRAFRGSTDYVVAASGSGKIGMSAAPHSRVTSDRR
jgi:hypothetical protein